jgi:hypothetical protein
MGIRLFCVDGTNLVRTAYGYGGPAHMTQEQSDSEHLAEVFAQVCEEAGSSVEVELFFDGPFRSMPGGPANFSVSFTHEVAADDLILDRVRAKAWNKSGSMTVVTADGDLGRTTEAEGGKWLRVSHGSSPESVARRIGGRFSR